MSNETGAWDWADLNIQDPVYQELKAMSTAAAIQKERDAGIALVFCPECDGRIYMGNMHDLILQDHQATPEDLAGSIWSNSAEAAKETLDNIDMMFTYGRTTNYGFEVKIIWRSPYSSADALRLGDKDPWLNYLRPHIVSAHSEALERLDNAYGKMDELAAAQKLIHIIFDDIIPFMDEQP